MDENWLRAGALTSEHLGYTHRARDNFGVIRDIFICEIRHTSDEVTLFFKDAEGKFYSLDRLDHDRMIRLDYINKE